MVRVRGRELIEQNHGDAESGTGIIFSLPKRSGKLQMLKLEKENLGLNKGWKTFDTKYPLTSFLYKKIQNFSIKTNVRTR